MAVISPVRYPKSDCHYRCGSHEETPAGEKEFVNENMHMRTRHKPNKKIQDDVAKWEAGNASLQTGEENTQVGRANSQSVRAKQQAGGQRMQRARSKPILYHKIHIYESKPKLISIHKIGFTVV